MYVPLYRTQAEFLSSPALYRAFIGGRGSGKSWVACYDLVRRARPGRTYLVASPTYPMLFDSEAKTFARLARELGVLRDIKLSVPASARLNNGAEVLLRSADDPERLRGPNLSGAVLMEAAIMHRDAYEIAIACLREGGEQGWLTCSTTPKGPSHWTHEVFATGRPDTALFRARTDQNPFLPPEFAATLERQYGDTQFARQELGGEFVQIEGAEFPSEWFDRPGFWFEDWPEQLVAKVLYLDPSKGRDAGSGDYQAHVMAGLAREPTSTPGSYALRIYLDAQLEREPVPDMIARTIRLCREWGPVTSIGIEDNGTMGFLAPEVERQSRAAGILLPWLPVTNTEPKLFRVRGLVGYLSRGQVRVRNTPGGRLLRAQLGDFPLGEHDDGPDAAAGAVRLLEQLSGGW